MGEKSSPGGVKRFCDDVPGFACAFAQGERCGVELYLEGLVPQIRGAMKKRLQQMGASRPEGVERRCVESLHGGKILVGVMGPGEGATPQDKENAFALGELIAKQGWVLLTGGRPVGVMAAVNRGAKAAGGLTVGILPSRTITAENTSPDVDIRIVTGLGEGRNVINVLSSDVVLACGMSAGTASEVALALKAGKQVVLLSSDKEAMAFFGKLGKGQMSVVATAQEAVRQAQAVLTEQMKRLNTPKREGREGPEG